MFFAPCLFAKLEWPSSMPASPPTLMQLRGMWPARSNLPHHDVLARLSTPPQHNTCAGGARTQRRAQHATQHKHLWKIRCGLSVCAQDVPAVSSSLPSTT